MLIDDNTKGKVVAINNASRALDKDDKRTKKLLKEDLYLNLKRLMERNQIVLLRDTEITQSLKSVMFESDLVKNNTRIYGNYTHIVEGLIRAAWCVRDKKLELFFESM